MGQEQVLAQLPQEPQHAKKASMEEVFEHRWRKAYEVRALERESRQAKSQAGNGSAQLPHTSNGPAGAAVPMDSDASIELHAAAGQTASDALSKLSVGGSCAATGAAPTNGSNGTKTIRQQEIVDDDEDGDCCIQASASAAARASNAANTPGASTQQDVIGSSGKQAGADAQQEGLQEEDEEEEEMECRLVWDSSSRQPGAESQPLLAAADGEVSQLKEKGNACLKAGEFQAAVGFYTQALAACKQEAGRAQQGPTAPPAPTDAQRQSQEDAPSPAAAVAASNAPSPHQHLAAMLLSNRSHAYLKLRRSHEAAEDAQAAHKLHSSWTKPLYRLAQARLALGHWAAAVAACKRGHELAPKNSEGHTEFTPLMDRVAVCAARAGSLAGYDGQQLEVRDAGKDAWQGREAPHVPELDGPLDDDSFEVATTLPLLSAGDSAGGNPAAAAAVAGGDALVSWDYRQTAAVLARRRTSFRSIREAVKAARDGDRILLLAGQHNGMGECVHVSKRVLIEGQGQLGETIIDQRANSPTFRITRGGVTVRNLVIDQSGFHDALLIEGGSPGAAPRPLIQDCHIKCSGDDTVNVAGSAAPTFLRCLLEAKKVGLKAYGSSAPRLERCMIEKCEEQGVRLMEAATAVLHSCAIKECKEEAVVAMDEARVSLLACHLADCKGPGVDLSGSAQATIYGGKIEKCVGGVWLWDAAKAVLKGAHVVGGPSHVVLADGEATLEVRDSILQGVVHASDAAWQGILHASNKLEDPDQPVDFPGEEGPFRFVPDPYKRKQ